MRFLKKKESLRGLLPLLPIISPFMEQVWITKYGAPSVLKLQRKPSREPGKGELKITVHYCGINFADLMCRLGLYPTAPKPPFVPGYEVSGFVERVGADVPETLVGKPVLGIGKFGCYSSEIILPMERVIALQTEEQLKQAAAIPVNYFTAFGMMVKQAHLQSGEWVLIHGIGGGVGLAAWQLAQLIGARVIGTASAHKHTHLRELGVEHLIDYHTEDFVARVLEITGRRGADVILDPIGGTNLKRSYQALAKLGKLVNYGFSAAARGTSRFSIQVLKEYLKRMKFDPVKMMMENKGVFGFHLGFLDDRPDFTRQVAETIMTWFNTGEIQPVVDRVFPLSQAPEAHQYLHDHKNFGKVLLSPVES